ncbi:MAG: hypothetical protein K9M98_07180 [Cephaloticoccus sp.]|nr:hypothetical protein [Cephaloticoccus sp.]MCF7760272.1 hypothetical protein [Cephaloticoccus sp.]
MKNNPLPVEIVGGGLAGLSLGLALRRENVPVTIHDTGLYPRHRVCGEFITGLSETTIARLGLAPFLKDALHHHSVAWFLNGRPIRTQNLPHPALALSRYQLDHAMAECFVEAGGSLCQNSRITDKTSIPGRIVAKGRRRGNSSWLGLKIHAENVPLLCDLELHLGNQCYIGLTRLADNRVNICGLFGQRNLSAQGVDLLLLYLGAAGLPELANRLAAADFKAESFCAVAAVGFDRQVSQSVGMRLGDACAMIPPFTGNGMAMALQSAETALEPVLAYAHGVTDWPTVCATVHQALRRRFYTRLTSAHLLHPFMLRPRRQRWLSGLTRSRLFPLQTLYALLH